METQRWQVIISPEAKRQLAQTKDQRILDGLAKALKRLEHDPEKQGKELGGNLAGYRSVRAIGQRYHIIYRVEAEKVLVAVVTVGIRKEGDKKDAYALAKRLARLGLLDLE
jgi:mRNA interferase RelE/StbE